MEVENELNFCCTRLPSDWQRLTSVVMCKVVIPVFYSRSNEFGFVWLAHICSFNKFAYLIEV
jgi:hypothetical protein